MEALYRAVEEEAKQPIAVPNEQADGCTLEQEQGQALFLFLFLCLYHAVGEQEGQPAAVPNELEDDDTGEQVGLQEKDPRCSHLENQDENWEAAVEAVACASSECDVECDGELDYPKCAGHVRFAVQRSGPGGECWVECHPWMDVGHQKTNR